MEATMHLDLELVVHGDEEYVARGVGFMLG